MVCVCKPCMCCVCVWKCVHAGMCLSMGAYVTIYEIPATSRQKTPRWTRATTVKQWRGRRRVEELANTHGRRAQTSKREKSNVALQTHTTWAGSTHKADMHQFAKRRASARSRAQKERRHRHRKRVQPTRTLMSSVTMGRKASDEATAPTTAAQHYRPSYSPRVTSM